MPKHIADFEDAAFQQERDDFYYDKGDLLRAARERRRISRADAAKEIKISPRTLQSIELGKSSISLHQFVKLCKLYGISPAEVLKSDDEAETLLGQIVSAVVKLSADDREKLLKALKALE